MSIIEETLGSLDNYFKDKTNNEKWIIILSIAAIIAYIAFSQFLPYTKENFENSKRTEKRLNKSILDQTIYLKSITVNGNKNYYINKYIKDIKQKKNDLNLLRSEIMKIEISLSKLSDMLFNEKSWSIFLNSMTNKGLESGIKINYIKNNYVDNNGTFGHILELSIGCEGNFKSIVKFINSIEQNKLVTDIYGSDLILDENSTLISADLNISVWGINY